MDLYVEHPHLLEQGLLPPRKEMSKLVSAAEKAEILHEIKERDFQMKSVTPAEFATFVQKLPST